MMLPQAEWISMNARRAVRMGVVDSRSPGEHETSPREDASPTGSTQACSDDVRHSGHREYMERIVAHRGSGGLVRGRAMFCLPPNGGWFQGHFAYASSGQALASLGVLGTELPVDPCMRCRLGGFSRFKLVFIHHESGKEANLIVERYGGNMMSLKAEPWREADGVARDAARGDTPLPLESELAFQTHVMKADEDARPLLDRYFQSIVRAASDPAELRDCIVCIGPMDVPRSLLQELAAPLQDGTRIPSIVCAAFGHCREAHNSSRHDVGKPTPVLSPLPQDEEVSFSDLSDHPARPAGGGGGRIFGLAGPHVDGYSRVSTNSPTSTVFGVRAGGIRGTGRRQRDDCCLEC